MSIAVSHHAVLAWQKRFDDIEDVRQKIREVHDKGLRVSVEGKSERAVFDPKAGSILIVRNGSVRTVLFVENQKVWYDDYVECANCGNRLNSSEECPRCGCDTHKFGDEEFDVDW